MSEKKSKKELIGWAVHMGFFPNVTAARKESHENLQLAYDGHHDALKKAGSLRTPETPEEQIERLRAKLATIKGVPFAQRKRRAIEKKIRKLLSRIPSTEPIEQRLARILGDVFAGGPVAKSA